ncbi:MAG TPA: hypothetical protein VE377_27600 [Candidatus Dormibacteraeota bacterium]|nr:hypothetical protein [Candidatus Dormibacteraeota bacterium]
MRAPLKSLFVSLVLSAAFTPCLGQSPATDKPTDKYKETGNVLSAISKHGHFYQIATDSRIYLLMCGKVGIFGGEPECKVGDKPIAAGDTVHFRIDGDWAYVPLVAPDAEDKLRILTTELKVIPALPPAASPANPSSANASSGSAAPASASPNKDKDSTPTFEPGIVIGTGLHVKGQHGVGWSTMPATGVGAPVAASAATPVMATAPVMAVPVTGGPPVFVTPIGPTTGGVVTGVPVTGGPPVTAIPTAPVMGVPVGGAPAAAGPVMMGGGRSVPQWVHVLRIQTAGKIYQLECSSKPCALVDKEIALGDSLTLRVDKKHAYLSSGTPGSTPEREFKILSVSEPGSPPDSKQP